MLLIGGLKWWNSPAILSLACERSIPIPSIICIVILHPLNEYIAAFVLPSPLAPKSTRPMNLRYPCLVVQATASMLDAIAAVVPALGPTYQPDALSAVSVPPRILQTPCT